MGPSVKFVSAIKDAFFNKKMGVNFFLGKKTKPGGSEGGLVKDHTFPNLYLGTRPFKVIPGMVVSYRVLEWSVSPSVFNIQVHLSVKSTSHSKHVLECQFIPCRFQ